MFIRLAFAGGVTAYLLWKSRPQEVLTAAATADWRPISTAVLLVLADRALMAYRWVALLCTVDPADRPPLGALMRIFFVSTFVGTFLPASIGSDALRSYRVAQLHVKAGDAVASVVMDRMLGVGSILIMGILGVAFAGGRAITTPVIVALAAAAAVCLVMAALVFTGSRRAVSDGAASPLERLQGLIGGVVQSVRKYSAHPRVLLNVLGCSVAVQVLRIVQAYFLGRGLSIDTPAATYFAFVPIILLVMLLPVTFNGIGTSQAAFVWFFGQAGVPAPQAFALSILFVALGVVGNLPGALLYVFGEQMPNRGGEPHLEPQRPMD